PDEFGRAVHGSVEVRLGSDVAAAVLAFGLGEDAGVQIRIDGHLLAGHSVQGEAGRDLGDAAGALGNDDELDDDQYDENDGSDHDVARGDEGSECVDDFSGLPFGQHQAGGGHVQAQPEHGDDEQHTRENREVE